MFDRMAGLAVVLAMGPSPVYCGPPEWLEVPYVRQHEAGCGAASIAMVMQYWIRHDPRIELSSADADRIYELLAPSRGKGISGKVLKRYLEEKGFKAFVFDGELRDLRHHLEKGRPLVVCLAPRGPDSPLHYVVVVGVEETAVFIHDPARGKLMREDVGAFQRDWKATGNWTMLAVPRP